MSKPEEHEGMPHHQHCPHAKRSEDRNLKCHHDEQQKDSQPLKTEKKKLDMYVYLYILMVFETKMNLIFLSYLCQKLVK
jgi:hypothetical protein